MVLISLPSCQVLIAQIKLDEGFGSEVLGSPIRHEAATLLHGTDHLLQPKVAVSKRMSIEPIPSYGMLM